MKTPIHKLTAVLLSAVLYYASALPAHARIHVLQFIATAGSNLTGDSFFLDDPSLNGKPLAKLIVTQITIVGNNQVTNPHPVGVYFDINHGARGMWAVYNEDIATMPAGAAFNVLVGPMATVNATPLNSFGSVTCFKTAAGQPPFYSALEPGKKPGFLFFIHNFDPFPTLLSGILVNHNQSLGYESELPPRNPLQHKWNIYNEDSTPALAASYFVFDASPLPKGAAVFGQTANVGNIEYIDQTAIINPATDGKTGAVLFIAPVNVSTNVAFGVYYNNNVNHNQWSIITEDSSAFPAGTNFNVLVFPGVIP